LLATRLGAEAAERIIAGESGILVGMENGAIITTPLGEVALGKKPLDPWFLKTADVLAR
jgi:6-phosphofructokinase 1